eukprot:1764605-Pleurochrysis_carterae.AAC.4
MHTATKTNRKRLIKISLALGAAYKQRRAQPGHAHHEQHIHAGYAENPRARGDAKDGVPEAERSGRPTGCNIGTARGTGHLASVLLWVLPLSHR